MVNCGMDSPRCCTCPEVVGEKFQGYVFCMFLNHDVWGQSIRCPHGMDLAECF